MLRMEITCFLVLFMLAIIYFSGERKKSRSHETFCVLLIALMIHMVFDGVTIYTANRLDIVPLWLNNILHRAFSISLLITLHYYYEFTRAMFMDETQYYVHQDWFLLISRIYLGITCIIEAFAPVQYQMTDKGNYESGFIAYVLYFSGFLYIVMISACIYRHWKGIHHKKRIIIVASMVIEFFVVASVLLEPTFFVSGMGMTIMGLACYFTLDSPDMRLLEQAEEERKKAAEAYAYKSKFLSIMSHEIRTPMNAMLGMTELMFRDRLTEKQRAYMEEIKSAGDSLVSSIDKMIEEEQHELVEKEKTFVEDVSGTPFIAPTAKLLVVDDNATNRKVFVGLLEPTKIQIDQADGGNAALELIKTKKYDIIFLDHMMPEKDGIEVRQEILSWEDYPNKNTPVIVLTANVVPGAREQYMEAGFDDFLTKPIDVEQLEVVIERLLPEEKKQVREQEKEKVLHPEPATVLPTIEGVDWDYALLKLKEEAMVKDVVKDYSILARNDLEELQTIYKSLVSKEDNVKRDELFEKYRVKVHSMKTSAAMFGALNVASLARVLEFAARDKEVSTIESVMDIFSTQWTALKNEIDDMFQFTDRNFNGKLGELSKERLQTYLDQLAEAMKELDIDVADRIMEELKQYHIADSMKGCMEDLVIAVHNLDSDKALLLIEQCR